MVPISDLARLAAARRAARPDAVTETLLVEGGRHSWLYEFPEYRAAVARFLTANLGGPFTPDEAARVAAAVQAERLPDPERLTTLDEEPGGFRSLSRVLRRQESAGSTTNGATTPDRHGGQRRRRTTTWRRPRSPTPPRRSRDERPRGGPCQARDPVVRRPPARAGRPRPDPRRGAARPQLEEPAALGVHRRGGPRAAAGPVDGRPLRRPHRRRGGRGRAGDAGPVRPGRAR